MAEPPLPWHTERSRIAALAGALGLAAGVVGKISKDIILYAQSEVAELREAAPGGSSTLPHKRNPVAAIGASAAATQAPGLVATLLTAMTQEHQRAAGAWHAEWRPLRALLEVTGSAAHWLRTSLGGLTVDEARMRANLDRAGDALLAERVSGALAPAIGAREAYELVRSALAAGPLAADARITARLPADELARLLDPTGYLGAAGTLIDRALAQP